ncbi:MAG TPA: ATP-binding protein [Thermoanaerobaculia bacterium]|nr:ATP-binding protein [Thermoanaerobaculia bacterium]
MRPTSRVHAPAWLLALFLPLAGSAQELPFTHFTTEHHATPLPLSNLQRIHQDRLGYLWLGFYGSVLARYDGHSFESYTPEDGVPEFTVREIVESHDGRLWIGSDSGVAVSDRPLPSYAPGERVRFVSHGLVQTRIRQNGMAVDRDGWIWVGTQGDGVHRYRFDSNGRLETRRIATAETRDGRNAPVVAIGVRRDGSVWVSLNTGKAIVVSGETARWIQPPCTISTLHERKSLWLGCMTGEVWRIDSGTQVVAGGNAQITAIQETVRGDVWIATHGAGVMHIDGATRETYSRSSGMPGNIAWDILEDREGNLWFAQEGGLSRLRFDHAAFLAYRRLLADESVLSVLPRRDESDLLWIGTTGGLTAIRGRDETASFTTADGLYSDAIYSLATDDLQRVWVGTSRGLHAIVADAALAPPDAMIRPVTLFGRGMFLCTLPLDNNPIYAARRIGADMLCFASPGSLRCLANARWYFFDTESGLSPTGATSVEADRRGHLWIGTSDRGVLRSTHPVTPATLAQLASRPLMPNAVQVTAPVFAPLWNKSVGAPTNAIRNLLANGDEMWIGTARGLAVFRAGKLAGVVVGLRGQLISGIAHSPASGTLWVSQNSGLAEVDPSTRRLLRVVTKHDGLADGEAWGYGSVAADDRGTIFVATAKGLTLYRPGLDLRSGLQPPLRLRAISVEQNDTGGNRVDIRFAALSFTSEQHALYRTRLVGYEEQWSALSPVPEVHYANLPAYLFPKNYRFEVMATSRDGVSSEPAAYSFTIKPAWWFRWWALLAYLALIALLIRWRMARLEAHNVQLQQTVDARTAELRAQTEELQTLDQIVRTVSRELTLDGVLRSLLEEGMRLFPQAEKGVFVIFDHQTGRSEIAATVGFEPDAFRHFDLALDETVRRYSETADQLGEGLFLVRDYDKIAESDEKLRLLPAPKSFLAMEATLSGRVEGLLVFSHFSNRDAFRDSDLQKLKRYREHASLAIAKAVILRELQTKNREALEATEAKSMFLANMSHELRTPMNAVIGFSAILIEKLEKTADPKHLNFLKMIHAAGEHLLNIINDILDLSKVEAGKMQFFPEPFRVRDAVESVCHVMRGVSRQKAQFEIDVPDDLPLLESDPAKFKQVLYNLLSNAVKFSPQGSTVMVVARQIRTPACDAAISLSVIDRGVGIAEENLGSLFDEFRQVGAPAQEKGTGLGLSLVKKFVEMQGGQISVRSRTGRGSTFMVVLPVRWQGASPAQRTADQWPEGDRVLLVEDEAADYCVTKDALESAGFIPIRARRGEEALRLARTVRPVAITLDIVLPDIDGWEVLKMLKGDPATRDIPVVIISRADNRELGFALGADDYLIKPLDSAQLLFRLAQVRRRNAV